MLDGALQAAFDQLPSGKGARAVVDGHIFHLLRKHRHPRLHRLLAGASPRCQQKGRQMVSLPPAFQRLKQLGFCHHHNLADLLDLPQRQNRPRQHRHTADHQLLFVDSLHPLGHPTGGNHRPDQGFSHLGFLLPFPIKGCYANSMSFPLCM